MILRWTFSMNRKDENLLLDSAYPELQEMTSSTNDKLRQNVGKGKGVGKGFKNGVP